MQGFIEVREGSTVRERNVTRKADGKVFSFREQEVFVHNPRGEVKIYQLRIDEAAPAYPAGRYGVDPSNIDIVKVGNFDRLGLFRIDLIPISSSALKAA